MVHGSITLTVDDKAITLAAGDAVAIPGDEVHCYANAGEKPSRFSLAVFEPGVGTTTRTEVRDA